MKQVPIPGQSWTTDGKSRPWQKPPKTADPEKALQYHLMSLTDSPDAIVGAYEMVRAGATIKDLVTMKTRAAVASGIHSIDVSAIIAPVLHEFFKGQFGSMGVEVPDGLEPTTEEKLKAYAESA